MKVYTPIVPNHGLYESRVLGLEVQVADDRLRFYAGTALLLESEERLARAQAMYDSAQRRADEEALRRDEAERLRDEVALRRDEAERRADEEAQRREEAEREVAHLRAELERLKR